MALAITLATTAALIIAYVIKRHLRAMAVTIVRKFLPLAALALMTGAAQAQRISCEDLGEDACFSGSGSLQGVLILVVIVLGALYWILNNLEAVLETLKGFIFIALCSAALFALLLGSWYLLGNEGFLAALLVTSGIYGAYWLYGFLRPYANGQHHEKKASEQKASEAQRKSREVEGVINLLNSKCLPNTAAHKPSQTDPYQQAYLELLYGKVDAKLWAKSLAKSMGNDSAARASYLKYRMAQLNTAIDIEAAQDKGDT